MEKVILNATRRNVTGKQVGAYRRQGKLPAIMYGHGFDATPIFLDLHETTYTLAGLSSSHIVTINLDGKEYAALVREKQRNYLRNELIHLDFQVVSLTEKLRTEVAIELKGVAPAVKDFNGVVVTGINSIEVECFPQDLPDSFIVDISTLANIGDAIHLRDLQIPATITVHEDPDELLVLITAPAAEEVAEEGLAEAGLAEPEVIERGKKEEEVEE